MRRQLYSTEVVINILPMSHPEQFREPQSQNASESAAQKKYRVVDKRGFVHDFETVEEKDDYLATERES